MYSYSVGLQIHSDEPEHTMEITAQNSDRAWEKAQAIYRNKYDFNNAVLTTMVLWNEQKILNSESAQK